MEILGQTSIQAIVLIVIYSITGVVPLIAALYLLLRRGNAFAPDTTPPVRLRRWATAFFAVAALGHVWWFLLFVFSGDIRSVHSIGYLAAAVLDYVTMLPAIAGTLLAMLQDRRRPMWPVIVAMIPIVALGGVLMANPDERLMLLADAYIVSCYVLFAVYVAFAVRQYGRWLLDNYADLEHKEVWQSLAFAMVLFVIYAVYTSNMGEMAREYLSQVISIVIIGFFVWRVETLQELPSEEDMANGSLLQK